MNTRLVLHLIGNAHLDRGEYRFRFVLTDAPDTISGLANELIYPPTVQMTWSH